MAIQVEHEDIEELKKWGMGLSRILERCVFCNNQTRYWHMPTNNPVCPHCASLKSVSDLPK